MLPRIALPPSAGVLALLAAAFLLPGLMAHDLWKAGDAIGIEAAHQMARGGDWVVPRVAGEYLLADPPLYTWFAAALGTAFEAAFGFSGAARLASGLFVALALALIHVASRRWSRDDTHRESSAAAVLATLGAVGLVANAHEAIPELAGLAACAGAFAALAFAPRRPVLAGAGFGLALGAAFLANGPVLALALLATSVVTHLAVGSYRHTRAIAFHVLALALFVILAGAWVTALALRAPEAYGRWWPTAWTAREIPLDNLRYFIGAAAWAAWPAWPLAVWCLWAHRRSWRDPGVFAPATGSVFLLLAMSWTGPRVDDEILVLLVPLALLAGYGVARLRRGAAAALDWFGVMTFAFFGGLVWLGYVAMMTGMPPRIERNFLKTAPGFVAQFDAVALAVAVLVTAGWLYIVLSAPPSPTRGLLRWAAGIALLWGTFATLWLPWADFQKSYRGVALQLRAQIPPTAACITRQQVGLPQRAAFSYHAGIRTRAFDVLRPEACPLMLVQGSPRHEVNHPGPLWRKLADVGRPGDKSERFRLYRLER